VGEALAGAVGSARSDGRLHSIGSDAEAREEQKETKETKKQKENRGLSGWRGFNASHHPRHQGNPRFVNLAELASD